jgi:hypothetical protein
MLDNLGDVRVAQSKLRDALGYPYQQSLAIGKLLDDQDKSNSDGQRDVAVSLNDVGDVLVDGAYLKATVTHVDKYGRLCSN